MYKVTYIYYIYTEKKCEIKHFHGNQIDRPMKKTMIA